MILQVIRRTVQVGTIVLIIMMPMLSLYAHYRSAHVIHDPDLMAGLRGEVAAQWLHPWMEKLDDPQALLDGNKGTLWSMKVFGVEWTDPLAALETVAASKHVHWPLLVSIVIPVALTLMFGRVFCSWICPGYLLFELTGKLRKLLRLAEITPGELRFSLNNKYIFLAVGLLITLVVSTPLFALIYPPAVISRALHAWVFGTALTGMLVLLGCIVAIEVFVSPRWWCRTICPGGALYALIGWLRPVRVILKRDLCTGCQACVPVCEAGINPITDSASIECDNCGVCINHCDDGALVYTIGLPGGRRKNLAADGNPRRAKVPAALVAALVCVLPAGRAEAHHILGLPHYSYKENYPQRPTLEYPATTGPYDVLLTSYPGVPKPGEPANLAIYIKNRNSGVAYVEPITVRVLLTSTFGDNTVIFPSTTREPFDNEFKFYVTMPVDGEYIVEVSMPVEGRVEVIPFLMVVGQPTATMSIVIAAVFGIVVMLVVVRAVQKKRRRKRHLTHELPVLASNGQTPVGVGR